MNCMVSVTKKGKNGTIYYYLRYNTGKIEKTTGWEPE